MVPSSRTPEGRFNHCPFCKKEFRIEPSDPPGDAPCSHCGCLIWFDPASSSEAAWDTVENTKKQIREMVRQIADLGLKDNISIEEYYAAILPKVVASLAAEGGAIWRLPDDTIKLVFCINREIVTMPENRFRNRHELLLQTAFHKAESMLVPPGEDYGNEIGGNPSSYLLLLSPIIVNEKIVGLLEIFQRSEASSAAQSGYQRFLAQICRMASESVAVQNSERRSLLRKSGKKPWWKFWQKQVGSPGT